MMNEQETRSRLIRPAITEAGWSDVQIREEYPYTLGRIHVSGNTWKRGENKKVDFLLEYKPSFPLAIIEAKHIGKSLGAGMQQALNYAEALDVPFVFSTNGKGFLFHDRTGQSTVIEQTLDQLPSPEYLYNLYASWKGDKAILHTAVETPYYTDNLSKSPRYFQRIAINRTVEAISQGQKRALLVIAMR